VAALYPIVRRTDRRRRRRFPVERAWADARPAIFRLQYASRPRASTTVTLRERARIDARPASPAAARCCCSSPALLVPSGRDRLFFNLRLGEIVLHDHAVPRTNLLSFTYPDYRDVNLAWLFQIVLALAHRAAASRARCCSRQRSSSRRSRCCSASRSGAARIRGGGAGARAAPPGRRSRASSSGPTW
jgi:hypothetical protein